MRNDNLTGVRCSFKDILRSQIQVSDSNEKASGLRPKVVRLKRNGQSQKNLCHPQTKRRHSHTKLCQTKRHHFQTKRRKKKRRHSHTKLCQTKRRQSQTHFVRTT